jgi:hypothetical protein
MCSSPWLKIQSIPVSLEYVPLPSIDECVTQLQEVEAEMKVLSKQLPYSPKLYAPFVLDPQDTTSVAYRFMELGSARAYWGIAVGRAKLEARSGPTHPKVAEITLLALDQNVAVIGVPGTMCWSTITRIKQHSPFSRTLVWNSLGPHSLSHIIPAAEGTLGGAHRAGCDYTEESINRMVTSIVEGLNELGN